MVFERVQLPISFLFHQDRLPKEGASGWNYLLLSKNIKILKINKKKRKKKTEKKKGNKKFETQQKSALFVGE